MKEWKVSQVGTGGALETILNDLSQNGWTIVYIFDTVDEPYLVIASRTKEFFHESQ